MMKTQEQIKAYISGQKRGKICPLEHEVIHPGLRIPRIINLHDNFEFPYRSL